MKLYNTLTRTIDELVPLEANNLKIYTCGLTVYSQPQIGNWVAYIYSDVLVRTLDAAGYDITRTQNITDVGHLVSDDDTGEDKMEKGARQEGLTAWDVAKKYAAIAEYEAYELLHLKRPDKLVPATALIPEQIAFAEKLDAKGYLYRTTDGMYFDTSKLSDYGKLARLDTEGLAAGARVEMAEKKNPTDFAVWKFSPEGAKRDMEWDSPWGMGFPGWHLECSVIARETLGDQIDIHTGGIDHIPVHHTNEIAQTEAVTGKQFVQSWFHNNHIKVNGTKLSKSLGNSYTLNDITERGFAIDAFKLLVLSSHYRTEGNFSWEILDAAQNRLHRWKAIACLRHQIHDTINTSDAQQSKPLLEDASEHMLSTLTNDLDTPRAIAHVDQTFDVIEKTPLNKLDQASLVHFLETIDSLLGLQLIASTPDVNDETKQLLLERTRARENTDWKRSDEIRDELLTAGIDVRDSSHGPIWSYSRPKTDRR